MEYKILLIGGHNIKHPSKITSSTKMLSYAIIDSFSKLKHVTLYIYDDNAEEIPICDFGISILFNSKNDSKTYNKIKHKIKCKTYSFMETSIGFLNYGFSFLPTNKCRHISFPILSDVLNKHNKPKIKNTILLDHSWFFGNDIKNREWTCRIMDWLSPISKDYTIYKMVRNPESIKIPSFIKLIHNTNYLDYLDLTSQMEYFIITHSGSYNFSITDMYFRGTKVLTPNNKALGKSCFIPKYTQLQLNIPMFESKYEMLNIIKNKNYKFDFSKFTDFKEAINMIDKTIQKELKN